MEEQVLTIVEEELIPLILQGTLSGFVLGTVFTLITWGAFKAISLLNIKNI